MGVGVHRVMAGLLGAVLVGGVLAAVGATPAGAESLPQVSVADGAVAKPATGTAALSFTVRLLRPGRLPVSVAYATADGTAVRDRDYTATTGTLTFAAGQQVAAVSVPVLAGSTDTGNRSFSLNLSGALNGAIVRPTAQGLIVDSTPTPQLTVDDTAVVLAYGASGTATFTVSLEVAAAAPVTVRYATVDDTLRAGLNYTATTGVLTFNPGQVTKTVAVPLTGKVLPGARSAFHLQLSAPSNAALLDPAGYAFVTDPEHAANLTVDDVAAPRPASGTGTATVTVRLARPAPLPVSVQYATFDNSAVAGTDYRATAGTLTFPTGTTTRTAPVTLLAGAGTDPTRSFGVSLSGPSAGATLLRTTATVTIYPGGAAPNLAVQDAGLAKPLSGNAPITFTITLVPAPTTTTAVNYSTSDNSGITGIDYNATSGTVNFTAGQTSRTVTVGVRGGVAPTPDRTFSLSVSAGGTTTTRSSALGLIQAVDPTQQTPTVSVDHASRPRPTVTGKTLPFLLRLSPASPVAVTVAYSTSNNSAVAGTDYTATSGTATFAAGATTTTVSVPLTRNTLPTADVSFYLNLSAPTNATIGQLPYAVGLIRNQNRAPLISVADAQAYRVPGSAGQLTFTATLSSPSVNAVTVHYATSNNSAVAGTDYLTKTGTLTFAKGATTAKVVVTVKSFTSGGATTSFYLNLSAPTNAYLVTNYATGYLLNSNSRPWVTVSSPTVVVGTAATTAPFTFTLSRVATAAVTISYSTHDSSATAGVHYTAKNGTVTVPIGSLSASTSVAVLADPVSTSPRLFYVTIDGVTNGQAGAINYGYGAIEHATVLPRLSFADTTVVRPATGTATATFTATLQPASAGTVTVAYSTFNGSAVAGTDYTAVSGTLTFAPGDTSESVAVTVAGSAASGADIYFGLSPAGATNATLSRGPAYAEIVDGVAPVSGTSYLTVDDAVAVAPTSGSTTAQFAVTLGAASTGPVTVGYSTSDGTAVAGLDYTAVQGTLTFAPGQTSKTISVPVAPRALAQADRYFTTSIGVSSGPGSTFLRASATGTILTPVPLAQIVAGPDVSVVRGSTGTTTATVSVSLSPAQTVPVTVNYTTEDGTAVAGQDYTATSGLLTFAPGQTSRTVTVTVASSAGQPAALNFRVLFDGASGAVTGQLDDSRAYVFLEPTDTFTVAGTVTDSASAGVAGVTVTRTGDGVPTVSVVTAANGSFSFFSDPPGTVTISVTKPGTTFTPATQDVLVAGSDVTGVAFTET